MSKNKVKPISRKADIVVQELYKEILIYDLSIHKAFSLNETSALVWQACDGSRTIADISDAVGKQLNSQVNEDIIWLALDQFKIRCALLYLTIYKSHHQTVFSKI